MSRRLLGMGKLRGLLARERILGKIRTWMAFWLGLGLGMSTRLILDNAAKLAIRLK